MSSTFLAIKNAWAAYLLFLAWKLWTAPAAAVALKRDAPTEGGFRLFLAGLALTLSNPKVIVVFLALLPIVIQLNTLSLAGFAEIAALIVLILSVVYASWGKTQHSRCEVQSEHGRLTSDAQERKLS